MVLFRLHDDFALELARMHRVERCGHGTNLERRGADDLDVGTLSSKSFTMEETHASLSHDTDLSVTVHGELCRRPILLS